MTETQIQPAGASSVSAGLLVHGLVVAGTVRTPLWLDEHAGSSVRGALFRSLWGRFCANKEAPTCAECPLVHGCPVAELVAPLREEAARGQDVPRPYVVTPPPGGEYAPGAPIEIGVTLFGRAAQLFPYVALACQALGQQGLGKPVPARGGRRGQFAVSEIAAVHALTGERRSLFVTGRPRVAMPGLPVSAAGVAARAAALPTDRLTLEFVTPTRLTVQGEPVRHVTPGILVRRLLERLDALQREYGDGAGSTREERQRLFAAADAARVAEDTTRWATVLGSSARVNQRVALGGIVGRVTFTGDLAPLRDILVWGELVHVGKNAVKGAGRYRIVGE